MVSFLGVSRKDVAIVSLNFNNSGNLAIADSIGKVVIWQLSTYLTKMQEREDQVLELLFEASK